MPSKNEGPSKNESVSTSTAVKTPENVKLTPENYSQAIKDGNAEFLINNIGMCPDGTLSATTVSKMLEKPNGIKMVLANFSKLDGVNSQMLAEMIIDTGKGTAALYNNELDLDKSRKELSSTQNSMEARIATLKQDSMKDGKLDDVVYGRNLQNDDRYQEFSMKEKGLLSKTSKQEKFVMDLDKNKLFTKCLETKNFFTPERLEFFTRNEGGNRGIRSLDDALITVVESKKYDVAHINALLSSAADATDSKGLSEELFNSLKKNGFNDSTVSYMKKFNLPEEVKAKNAVSNVY